MIFFIAAILPNTCFAEDVFPGDSVFLGKWLQGWDDNNREPIEWIVLAVEEDKALLLTRYALSVDYLHEGSGQESNSVIWESSGSRVLVKNKLG